MTTKLAVGQEAVELIWNLCERGRAFIPLGTLRGVTVDDTELRDAGHLALENGLSRTPTRPDPSTPVTAATTSARKRTRFSTDPP